MTILRRSRAPQRDYSESVIWKHASGSVVTESYRMLRTSLLFGSGGTRPGVIVVTSALVGEGKSVTCANLASVFAKNDQSVVLIDADLRLPSQHRIFGIEDGTTGLGDLLLNDTISIETVDEVLHEAEPNLHVLCSGTVPPNPAELLNWPRFHELLDHLKARFDVVLIDTPPVNLVTDAVLVARKADGVVMVVNYVRANGRQTRRAIAELRKADANVLGSVLNRFPLSASGYGSYGYGYGGYGGYGAYGPAGTNGSNGAAEASDE